MLAVKIGRDENAAGESIHAQILAPGASDEFVKVQIECDGRIRNRMRPDDDAGGAIRGPPRRQ
jgi:hypothetical protein